MEAGEEKRHLVLVQVTLSLKANLARLAWSYLIVSVLKKERHYGDLLHSFQPSNFKFSD